MFKRALKTGATAIPVAIISSSVALFISNELNQSYHLIEAEDFKKTKVTKDSWIPPTRNDMIMKLKSILPDGKKQETPTVYDLLIIGGGATGVGCVNY